ncbi:TetR/AcrR family transcriptional regulator [Bacillus gobiensis]|uniref:TetR/AcrR family transcriptional regulator n=1 Tax=Bacillus gobiensis TaxID=1441095 RepID=UPI003D1BA677
MNGFARRTEQKKTAIEQAVLKILKQDGLKSVSIKAISDEAGVSQVSIYNYYGSKEELIHAAIQRYVKEEFDYFERLTESDKPFKEQFQLLIKRSHETGENISSEALKDVYSKNSSTKAMVDKYYEQLMPKISKWIQAGQSENVINPNVSIDTIMLYFNIWQNAMGQVLEMVEEKDLPRVKLELETLILHGIMKQ